MIYWNSLSFNHTEFRRSQCGLGCCTRMLASSSQFTSPVYAFHLRDLWGTLVIGLPVTEIPAWLRLGDLGGSYCVCLFLGNLIVHFSASLIYLGTFLPDNSFTHLKYSTVPLLIISRYSLAGITIWEIPLTINFYWTLTFGLNRVVQSYKQYTLHQPNPLQAFLESCAASAWSKARSVVQSQGGSIRHHISWIKINSLK